MNKVPIPSPIVLRRIIDFALGGDWGMEPRTPVSQGFKKVKVVRGTDFRNWSFEGSRHSAIRMISEQSLQKRRLIENDIVIEISGGGPDQPVGRTILIDAKTIQNEELPIICSNFFRQIRIIPTVDPVYVYYFLTYAYTKGWFDGLQTQTTNLRNLNFKKFVNETTLPLYSKPIQFRISEKILLLDESIRALKVKLRNLNSLEEGLINSYTNPGSNEGSLSLSDFLIECKKRIGLKWESFEKIGVDTDKGIVPLRFGKKLNFEKYKIVEPGDFIYNPMRINIGSIARYEGSQIAITSPDYVVFRIIGDLSPSLFLKFLKGPRGLIEINRLTRGSVRSRLYFKNLLHVQLETDIALQRQAEDAFSLFKILREKTKYLNSQLDLLFFQYLEKTYSLTPIGIKVDGGSTDILEEINKYWEEQQKTLISTTDIKKKAMVKKKQKSVIELIGESFGNNDFSFAQLSTIIDLNPGLEYDDFKEEFFGLLRAPLGPDAAPALLAQKIDENNELLFFKIAAV